MKLTTLHRKKIAIALLIIFATNILLPSVCRALTSGPTQPEAQSFQPASLSDMVDLFSGDFKYNIPLLDVDGYPINLNYESGSGMDDEASWTGLGWNVNIGAINRQVRGIPDDMSGDNIETDHYTKPKITIGGRVTAKIEFVGAGKDLTKAKASGSFGIGVFNDNYTGIGAEISANAGINFGSINSSPFTAGLGLGITSNTTSGVDVSPSLNLGILEKNTNDITTQAGLTASLGYNSRSGLKSLTLGSAFSQTKSTLQIRSGPGAEIDEGTSNATGAIGASGSFISFNTQPILPNIQVPYKTRYGSFSIDVGPAAEVVFGGFGGTGYKSVREVQSEKLVNPAYGFLYAEQGKNQKNAVMDFTRDNENPIIPETPNLAIPVHTPDLFTFTSQVGSGQFRLYRGGSGVFFDNQVSDDNSSTTIGGDIGYGFIFHTGVTLFNQSGTNTTRKWAANNNYLPDGDFQDISYSNPNNQHAYFKVVGEKTAGDAAMNTLLHDEQPLEVSITGKTANARFTNNTLSKLQKQNLAVNKTVVSYLTADQAAVGGLNKTINSYPFYDVATFTPPANNKPVADTLRPRVDSHYRQGHHLSEITVTNPSGKRMVYGLPVYNVKHSEYSYAIGTKTTDYTIEAGTNNIVPLSLNNPGTPTVSINHVKGIDNYYHMQPSRPMQQTSCSPGSFHQIMWTGPGTALLTTMRARPSNSIIRNCPTCLNGAALTPAAP